MRRRDESDIDQFGVCRTDRPNLMFLDYAKKFRLQFGRQFSNLVQEQGAGIGGLNQPLLVSIGSCECAAQMAEQFGFDQRLRQGRAIHRNKRSAPPLTQIVNGSGYELLPRAGLAANQYRKRTIRGLPDQLVNHSHWLRKSDETSWAAHGR